jgi:type IV pilus assembly protein PilB
MVLAQRLLRKLCPHCRTPTDPPEHFLERYKIRRDARVQFFKAVGCDRCNHIGYKGRIGVVEILVMDEGMRELVTRSATADELRRQAIDKGGMIPLQRDAVLKAAKGVTSPEEVLRVTG